MIIDVLIPAYNEAEALPLVLADIPRALVRQVIVCDNGSTDGTAEVARKNGAIVVHQPLRGYGNACLAGIAYIEAMPTELQPNILVFLDGDRSDHPEQMPELVAPLLAGTHDLVIGSRALGQMERGAMTIPQRFGNGLSAVLIRWFYGYRFTDLGPFRAIYWQALKNLGMRDQNFGWTVEMQVKAARAKLRCTEIPVRYRKRAGGKSKVSGTIRGTILAGWKILWVIFREMVRWKEGKMERW